MKPVNLLPDQHRAHIAGQRPGSAYAVIGVLGVLLVLLFAYALTTNQVNDRESEDRRGAGRRPTASRPSRRRSSPFGDFAQVKQTRMASVRDLAKGRFDWERLMRELSLILPKGSWLRAADASATGDIEGATAVGEEGAAHARHAPDRLHRPASPRSPG